MEFKKREVKRRSGDPKIHQKLSQETIDKIKNVEKRAVNRKNISDARRPSKSNPKFREREIVRTANTKPQIITVFVKCDMFQLIQINKINKSCPVTSLSKNFKQEVRTNEINYLIIKPSDGNQIIRYWNDELMKFFGMENSRELSRKIRYEVRDADGPKGKK